MEIGVNKFKKVNEIEFVNIVSNLCQKTLGHDCVKGGLVYIDEYENVLGISIPRRDNEVDFFLPSETETT